MDVAAYFAQIVSGNRDGVKNQLDAQPALANVRNPDTKT